MRDIGSLTVEVARTWIGTPYVHQASARSAGADCLGLVRGVWRALYGHEPCSVPPYSSDWGEIGHDEVLWLAARTWLIPKALDRVAKGDVLLFRMRQGAIAKHLGIQSEIGTCACFVHAFSGHSVIESPLSDPWRRRVVARFAFPN